MSEDVPSTGPLPVVPFLKIAPNGDPYLEGHVCKRCDAVFLGPRAVCSRCGARDQMQAKALSNAGRLYTYSIVHRSFPGIDVPFVSVVVDLEGGGTLKGNLINVAPDPTQIQLGMPVTVLYKGALGRKDKDGNSYLSYFFEPRSEVERSR
jgi:uncharacterized OB-fold protein